MAGPGVSRPMLFTAGAAVSMALAVGAYAVIYGGDAPSTPPGRCDVTATVSASADAAERPVALARDPHGAWALLVSPKPSSTDGSVRVRAVRVPDEGAPAIAYTGEAPSADAVSGFARAPDGVAFVIARGRDVTAYVLPPTGSVIEKPFPRGESPPGRDALTPAVSVGVERDGTLSALARWPSPFGALRLHARDVRESEAYTPRRADTFRAPDLAVANGVVLLAQEHLVGSFRGAAPRATVELVVMDASPAHPDTRATLTLTREGASGSRPRVALTAPDSPATGAAIVWRDEHGLLASRVMPDAARGWRVHEAMRVLDASTPDDAVTGDHDVASTRGACGLVAAWRSGGGQLVLRAFDLTRGVAGEPLRVDGSAGDTRARVRVERSGARTFVAADGAQGPRLYELTTTEACALTARPVALPSPAAGAGLRVAGFAASRGAAVLALTRAPVDASESALVFVTIPAALGAPPRLAPTALTVPQGASELAMLAGDVPVVVGRARGSVMLRRVGASDDVGEPGEDLLLRAMRGEEVAVDASEALHRVWVADASGDEETGFGPARSVVVHSAVDTLEDGPRTEVRPASVPYADFARVTASSLANAGDAAWGVTWSAGAGDGCVPGAWASLRAGDDRPVALREPPAGSPWPWALPLTPSAERSCSDRVLSASWEASHLAATLSSGRAGGLLVTGDVMAASMRAHPLDDRAGARPRMASVARAQNGLLAVWLDGDALSPSLRYRMFSREGAPRTGAVTLGEVMGAPGDAQPGEALPLAGGGGRYVTAFRTVHGPRMARISCGAVP